VVLLDGLNCIQKIEVAADVLDFVVQNDTLLISIDAKEGDWVVEYQHSGKEWEKVHSETWRITKREETDIVDLYYLETMRKRVGSLDDD
jgi:hypothetical protein